MTIEAEGPGAVTLGDVDRAAMITATKAYLRVESGLEDAVVARLGEAALALGEQFVGQVLVARAVRLVLPVVSGWQRLAVAPVRAITSVAAVAADGARVPLAVTGYEIDIDAAGAGWVRLADAGGARLVEVTTSAGLSTSWASLPQPLSQGVVMLAAYLFSERGTTAAAPAEVTALWRPFRRVSLSMAPAA